MLFESADIEQVSKDYKDFEKVFKNFMNKDALIVHRRWNHNIKFIKKNTFLMTTSEYYQKKKKR